MRHLKWRYKLPILLSIVIVVLLALWFIFRIRTVTVEGNTFFSEQEVAKTYQSSFWEKNLLTFFIFDKLGINTDPPYVRESEVTFPSINEAHIKLYEKTILAGVCFSNHYIYFDKDGMVLQSLDKALPDIPYFVVDDIKDFSLYQTLSTGREEELPQMMNLANRLMYYKIDWDRIEINSEGFATLYSGAITVLLGRHTDYDEILSVLSDILETAKKSKKSGEIDLSNYKAGASVIFKEK